MGVIEFDYDVFQLLPIMFAQWNLWCIRKRTILNKPSYWTSPDLVMVIGPRHSQGNQELYLVIPEGQVAKLLVTWSKKQLLFILKLLIRWAMTISIMYSLQITWFTSITLVSKLCKIYFLNCRFSKSENEETMRECILHQNLWHTNIQYDIVEFFNYTNTS